MAACAQCNDTGIAGELDDLSNPSRITLFFCVCSAGVNLQQRTTGSGSTLAALVRERLSPQRRAR